MAGIDARVDPRGAAWERRMRRPVLLAAVLAIPSGDKHATPFHGTWSVIEDAVP